MNWLLSLGAVMACSVAALEFGVDLEARPELFRLAIALSLALVAGFAGLVIYRLAKSPDTIHEGLRVHRVDVTILLLSVVIAALVPRMSATLIGIRLMAEVLSEILRTPQGRRFLQKLNPHPSQTVALSFVAMIAVGSIFLMLPAATTDGRGTSFTDAVFTVTSATTVTGLVVHDTGTYFTLFGQVVLLVIMQIGAIGIMVLAAAFAILVGGRLAGAQQEGLEFAGMGSLLNVHTADGLKKLVAAIAGATFVIEAVSAVIFYGLWLTNVLELPAEYDTFGGAAYWSIFYSISAFCHAGFTLTSDSLTVWAEDLLISNIFAGLITVAQLGFPVIADLWFSKSWRALKEPSTLWRTLHVQTRIVLVMTLLMNAIGMLAYLFFEYSGSLGELSLVGKVNAAFFQTVSMRSAGFNTVDLSTLAAPTVLLCLVWMFIGSAPGSVGGGVRTTTAAVVFLAVRAMAKGREEVEVFGRTVPKIIVYRSLAIFIIAGGACIGFAILLTASQPMPMDKVLFEAFSAFGTVGLSMGITSEFDDLGRWLLTGLMYIGRVGPLTMALAIGRRFKPRAYKYPDCEIAVG